MCASCQAPEPRSRHDAALDALEALSRAGLVVIPAAPTADMAAAGARIGQIDTTTAMRVFLAMLAAAP